MTTPTPQSDQAEELARKIVTAFEGHFREWMMPGEHAEAVEVTKEVIEEFLRAQSAELLALRAALIKYSEWFGPCLGTYPEEGEKNDAWDAEAQGIDDQVAAALNSPTQGAK